MKGFYRDELRIARSKNLGLGGVLLLNRSPEEQKPSRELVGALG